MSGSPRRVLAILAKEFRELRQLKALVWGALGMPLLFTVIPLGALYAMAMVPASEMSDMSDLLAMLASDPGFAALSDGEKMQIAMGRPMSMFILLLPVMIPSLVASYSIVGEKTSQTLEPLLATPIRTWELLVGKMLTAFVPTLALTWIFAGIFALGASALALSDAVLERIVGGAWIVAVAILAPALSMLAIAVTVGISSRAKDPRSAQEVAGFLVLPIVLTIPGQLTGIVFIGPETIAVASLVTVLLAAVAIWIVARLFDREHILTRWR